MKFISIQLNNWLVFRGQQKVSFPQDDHANILLIFGENMHGKTSLLNAVRGGFMVKLWIDKKGSSKTISSLI